MKATIGNEGLINLLKIAFDGFNELNKNPLLQVCHQMKTMYNRIFVANSNSMYHLLVASMLVLFVRSELLVDTVLI